MVIPEEAEIAVSKLIDAGWLIGDRESLRPAFDARSISTPIGCIHGLLGY